MGRYRSRVPLNASGVGSFEAAFGSNTVSSVEVTVVNASLRYTKCNTEQDPFACGGGKPTDEPVSGSVQVSVVA